MESSVRSTVPIAPREYGSFYFNPTDTYLLRQSGAGVHVWRLANLAPDGSANDLYADVQLGWDMTFVDAIVVGVKPANSIWRRANILVYECTLNTVSLSPLESETAFNRCGTNASHEVTSMDRFREEPELLEFSIYDGATYLFSSGRER
jgi:hypothetical protein